MYRVATLATAAYSITYLAIGLSNFCYPSAGTAENAERSYGDHLHAYLPLILQSVVGNAERFLSRVATTVLGAWHQMLRCDRKSSVVVEVWLAIVPACLLKSGSH